jgi:hypothetical protein
LFALGVIELMPATPQPYLRERIEATAGVAPDKLFYINLQNRAKSTFLTGSGGVPA